MTRKMKFAVAGLVAAAAIGGGAIAADTMVVRGPMRADTNGDGIVSRAEFFAAAETAFRKHDADGNRILSGTELKDKRGRFARQDADNDGKLTFAEAAGATASRFTRLDADRDGKLVPEELAPRPPHRGPRFGQGPDDDGPMGGPAGLRRMDANGDGRITRDEMRAQADRRFDRLDANRDGVIDGPELAARGPGRPGPGMRGMDGPPPPPPASPAPGATAPAPTPSPR